MTYDLTVEEGAQRQRPVDPESVESAFERPIVKHKSEGGPQTLKEAALDLSFSKYRRLGEDLLAQGYSTKQVQEIGDEAVARDLRGDPIAPPPAEVKVLEHFGEDKKVLTPTEAANEVNGAGGNVLAQAQAGSACRNWLARPPSRRSKKRSKRSKLSHNRNRSHNSSPNQRLSK